jgi:hypothetical protein
MLLISHRQKLSLKYAKREKRSQGAKTTLRVEHGAPIQENAHSGAGDGSSLCFANLAPGLRRRAVAAPFLNRLAWQFLAGRPELALAGDPC